MHGNRDAHISVLCDTIVERFVVNCDTAYRLMKSESIGWQVLFLQLIKMPFTARPINLTEFFFLYLNPHLTTCDFARFQTRKICFKNSLEKNMFAFSLYLLESGPGRCDLTPCPIIEANKIQ